MRQIIATAYGNKARWNIVIGEGQLRPLPLLGLDASSVEDGLDSLDREGQVRYDKRVTVDAFSIDDLSTSGKSRKNLSSLADLLP
jgi:hypothetical protein